MISYKFPVNIYRYRPTIFGLPIRQVLLISLAICFGILSFRINEILPAFIITATAGITIFSRTRDSAALFRLNLLSRVKRKRHSTATFNYSFLRHNGHTIFVDRKAFFMVGELTGPNIILMRTSTQVETVRKLQESLDKVELMCDFFTVPQEEKSRRDRHGAINFKTYLRVASNYSSRPQGLLLEQLVNSWVSLTDVFGLAEIEAREVREPEELSEFLDAVST